MTAVCKELKASVAYKTIKVINLDFHESSFFYLNKDV